MSIIPVSARPDLRPTVRDVRTGGERTGHFGITRTPGAPLGDRGGLAYEWLPQIESVLDLGCADGYVTTHLRAKASKVVGVDADVKDVRTAKKTIVGADFLVSIAEALPFAAGCFDAVLFLDVLEHVGDDRRAIDEVVRVLRPGGYLILSTPHKGLFEFLDPENFFLRRRVGRPRARHRHYSIDDYEKLFAGRVTVLRIHRGGLLLYPLCVIARRVEQKLAASGWRVPGLRRLLESGMNLAYRINFGRLGFNVMVLAQKNLAQKSG
jgi:SAM-dependent methyltransferase